MTVKKNSMECTVTFRNNELSIKEFDKLVDKSIGRSNQVLSAIKSIIHILGNESVIVEYVVVMNEKNQEEILLVSIKIGVE